MGILGSCGSLAVDWADNLHETTAIGGAQSCYYGIVFMLKHSGQCCIFTPTYRFIGGSGGSYPQQGLSLGPTVPCTVLQPAVVTATGRCTT